MPVFDSKAHPINHSWKSHYLTLEGIRQSGIVNMWGAAPYLAEIDGITQSLAKEILMSWITNYDELKMTYWPSQKVYVNLKDIVED